jgi:hypothetical protein
MGFPGGGMAAYEVDSKDGCIQIFFYKDGTPIKPQRPGWLVKDKNFLYIGGFGDLQCQQGIIGIGGSPTEYWGVARGAAYCIGAWDPDCGPYGKWYQPCKESMEQYHCP